MVKDDGTRLELENMHKVISVMTYITTKTKHEKYESFMGLCLLLVIQKPDEVSKV